MKRTVLFFIVFFLFIIACNRQEKKEYNHSYGPSIIKVKDHIVLLDSLAKPKIMPAGKPGVVKAGKPQVVLTNTNIVPAGIPKVVLAGSPKTFTPGEDSSFIQKTVTAVDSPFVAGTPEMVLAKDAYIKDNNPKNFSSFTKLQGLKHNNIFSIIQDNNGNLWFGNAAGGACRYDGKYFTYFTSKEGLPNNFITRVLQDKKGNIWFGTWGKGLSRFDGKRFTNFTKKDGLGNNPVIYSMLQDKSGTLWFGTMNGYISKYDGKSFTTFTIKADSIDYSVASIVQDKSGNIWFGTLRKGAYCFNGKTIKHFTQNEGLTNNLVHSMLVDKNGSIWFGLSHDGVCCYDGKTFKQYSAKEGLSDHCVFSIIQEPNGNLWFGTDGDGVILFNGKTFEHFTEREGLGNNSVYSLFQDKDGTIWIGGNGSGVSRYNGTLFTHFTEKEGLSDKRVTSILKDKDENLWFGTWNGGVNRYDGKSFTRYTKKEGLTDKIIYNIFQDKAGNLWFNTWGDGVICYDGKSFLHYTTKEGMPFNLVMTTLQDNDGNMWFGTDSEGECRFDGKYFAYYTEKEGFPCTNIMCSIKDRSGNLWFGTSRDGVYRYDGKSFSYFSEKEGLPGHWINSIFQDKSGNMWFGLRGGGVCRYNGKTLLCFTEKEGLCNNDVNNILQDKNGNMWFGTPFGLSKLSANHLRKLQGVPGKNDKESSSLFTNYTYEDGFLGIGCFGNSMCEGSEGNLWIGSNDRLTEYHPEGDVQDSVAPNIQLTGIQLHNENIRWLDLEKKKDTNLMLGNGICVSHFRFDSISHWNLLPVNLNLAYNNNYLTFTFVGITQKQSSKVKYRYMLEGLDENWSALTSHTEAPYGNIPHGTYTFKVKAMNSAGIWSKEFHYTFTIRPPWWKTWWAYTMYFLIFILLIGILIYSILENQRRKIRLIVNERNRISKELHDDIGAELTRLTMISQLLQNKPDIDQEVQDKLRKISDSGKKVLGGIGEIIWTMNPRNDNLDSLFAYIRRFVTEYLETNGIDVSIEFPEEIPANEVSDEYRRNVFLAIKEAVSNIIKYSKASSVRLTMIITEKLAEFEISDNGIGFSVKEKQNSGNGLRNMSERMKDVGGNFQISSDINQGTQIKLTFPVQ